jgi:MFS family permease
MCFMIMLDSNIVAVSLPSIARNLGAAFSDIEWVISAYVLTVAALLMPSGALADRYGRRRTALVGLSVFTLSSLLCGWPVSAIAPKGCWEVTARAGRLAAVKRGCRAPACR